MHLLAIESCFMPPVQLSDSFTFTYSKPAVKPVTRYRSGIK
jgi:hypothetical protein